MRRTLIYGYGNPGRQDDGLGARFVELFEKWVQEEGLTHVDTDCNYQLNIEDAAVIADYDVVIFVDASVVEEIEAFKLEVVEPNDATIEFTMHAVSTSYVADLCQKVYGKKPEVYVLHIKARAFDFVEELTAEAEEHMLAALAFLKGFVKKR